MGKHAIAGDERMNKPLREEIQGVRGEMLGAAERTPIPERFTVQPHDSRPAMIITDAETERSTVVSLYAYGDVREALSDLFGPGKGESTC